jgi:hypothetical protein
MLNRRFSYLHLSLLLHYLLPFFHKFHDGGDVTSVNWQFVTKDSEQPPGPIFSLVCSILEGVTYRQYRNAGNELPFNATEYSSRVKTPA